MLLLTKSDLSSDKPVRILGDIADPSRVVLETTGSMRWSGKKGLIRGVTLQRPRACPKEKALVSVVEGGTLQVLLLSVAGADLSLCNDCVILRSYESVICRQRRGGGLGASLIIVKKIAVFHLLFRCTWYTVNGGRSDSDLYVLASPLLKQALPLAKPGHVYC